MRRKPFQKLYEAANELLQNLSDCGEDRHFDTGEQHADVSNLEKAIAKAHLELQREPVLKINEAMRTVLDYVLEHEGEDYHDWCTNEGLDPDSDDAMSKHVYGSACRVLGKKPSYFDTGASLSD